jgi:hypothetical protein
MKITPEVLPDALAVLEADRIESGIDVLTYNEVVSAAARAYDMRTEKPFGHFDDLRVRLPQLADDSTNLDALHDLETKHYNPSQTEDGYVAGSATEPDQLLEIPGIGMLITAEHATAQVRDGKKKAEDHYVGSLAELLSKRTGAALLATLGLQTGDPNNDEEHAFKQVEMRRILTTLKCGHLSVHGCVRLTAGIMDERTLDFMIGIGPNPTDVSREAADKLMETARDFDLHGGVNIPFATVKSLPTPHFVRKVDGSLKTVTFAGGSQTTRGFADKLQTDSGLVVPAIQLELSSGLRPDRLYGAGRKKNPNQANVAANALVGFLVEAHGIVSSYTKK